HRPSLPAALPISAAISNSGGNPIDIAANRMALGAPPTSSTTANNGGRVDLMATTAGRLIDLGPISDPTGSLMGPRSISRPAVVAIKSTRPPLFAVVLDVGGAPRAMRLAAMSMGLPPLLLMAAEMGRAAGREGR